MIKISFLILLLGTCSIAIAEEAEHAAGPLSLLFPWFNFTLFFSFLAWKLKRPISAFFDERSKRVTDVYERANLMAKEAKIKQTHLEEKLKGLEREVSKINRDNADLMQHWENRIVAETKRKIEKLAIDAKLRLEAEKMSCLSKFKRRMLEDVTEKTKKSLVANKDSNASAGKKILESLRA